MPSSRILATLTAALFSFNSLPLAAKGLSEVALNPMEHREASLTIVSPDGAQQSYTPAALEELTTFELTTKTPWRDEPALFQGVRLRDLLALHGLQNVESIRVRAENDFVVTIPRSAWEGEDFLIATRVDGKPHNRRARGPIQFVLDWDAYSNSSVAEEAHLVWMAAEIMPSE